jgi:hypothetical protein
MLTQRMCFPIASLLTAAFTLLLLAAPTVFPTGTTIYDPARAWNGFTVLSPLAGPGAVVIDMNGRIVKQWDSLNSSAGGPARILPGGVVMGAEGARPGRQESLALVARDFDGNLLWRYAQNEQIELPPGGSGAAKGKGPATGKGKQETERVASLRQHHDWQRADFPAGYYSPGVSPGLQPGKTLVLTHTNRVAPAVAPDVVLEDDRILELDGTGKILWEWVISDHVEEFRLDGPARRVLSQTKAGSVPFDWMHLNSATYVGPNQWFDAGDQRFHPNNVIISSRAASIVAIVARDGRIVWQIGPDFLTSPELRAIRQIIGQHHAHLIPKGLPGEGNMLIFDNGGASGYGNPTPTSPDGKGIYSRPTSRVLEIDPVTLKLVWSYTSATFFATNISGAQRLANGNTLITEGPSGRIFEVTPAGDIIWEYVHPATGAAAAKSRTAPVYRAYRLPYEWIPQLPRPAERAVIPPPAAEFRLP